MTRKTSEQRSLTAYLADRDVPCPNCGYNLRGLGEGQCPECGFGFNLGAIRRHNDYVPLTEAMWDIHRWWWAAAVNMVLLALISLRHWAGLGAGETWFDHLISWPGRRTSAFFVSLVLGCLLLRFIAGLNDTDPARAQRIHMAVAVPVWLLTGIHAVGAAWTLCVAFTS